MFCLWFGHLLVQFSILLEPDSVEITVDDDDSTEVADDIINVSTAHGTETANDDDDSTETTDDNDSKEDQNEDENAVDNDSTENDDGNAARFSVDINCKNWAYLNSGISRVEFSGADDVDGEDSKEDNADTDSTENKDDDNNCKY